MTFIPYVDDVPFPYQLSEYTTDQWWFKELESIGSLDPLTADQFRAVRIAINCLKIALKS